MNPKIVISALDADRLEEIIQSMPVSSFPGRNDLEAELARAEIVDSKNVPSSVVTMNSIVKFKIESSSEAFCLKLVYPKDVDAAGGTISITAPVGSALLGLSQGDEIEWPKPGGGVIRLCVVEVKYQPERAGEYYR